jgi:hypothetical protein
VRVAVVALVLFSAVSALAQRTFAPARTPWGDPDLQGIWPSGQMIEVPFERPIAMGTRAVLNEAEFAMRELLLGRQTETDASEFVTPGLSDVTPPQHWRERGIASRQASLVVDPPDGRLPPLTADGARRAEAWRTRAAGPDFTGPEDFTPYDRCITRGVLGSVMPNIYGSGMEIIQMPGQVVIRYEMIHETRIVPLDPSRRHLSDRIRSHMGDPRGRWEGDTLIVETTNFNGRTGSLGRNGNGNPTSDRLMLVERFRLRDADTLDYQVTVDDPMTFTRPWTVAFPIRRDRGYVFYEYACHEGNYALANMLRAARVAEGKR